MIWAAKKGSKGESLQNALKILCDFCLLLLKQLIPARGRKQLFYRFLFFPFFEKQLIPARGRKPMCWMIFARSWPKQLIPARGRKQTRRLDSKRLQAKQLIPARGRKLNGIKRAVVRVRNNSSPRGDGNYFIMI